MEATCSYVSNQLSSQIMDFCRHIAGTSQVVAAGLVNNYPADKTTNKALIEALVVINNFQPRLMSYLKPINNKPTFILAVDQWIFERDIDRGFLGEAIASKLIFPHQPLHGIEYLHEKEVALKKRLIVESLENLAYSFPELANRLLIAPKYFLYNAMLSRLRVFPLLAYDLSNLLPCLVQNESQALSVYDEALKHLEVEGKIQRSNDYVLISKNLISKCKDPRTKIANLSKHAPRALFTSIFGVFPQLLNILSQNTEALLKTQRIDWKKQPFPPSGSVDPQKYIFFQTAEGLVSLADRINFSDFAKKTLLKEQNGRIEVAPFGGVLNDVYLITASVNGAEKKVLAKRFKDISGFKWFPLTLWSLGARSFVVSGQARLAKECAICEVLRHEGFNVPKLFNVSNAERLVFMEFIEGENLSEAIKRFSLAKTQKSQVELTLISKAGENLAKVHACHITLGDTKPENVLVKKDGSLYLIDFEQATRGGDRAWDIAVFLYYSGHYLQPFDSNGKAESLAKAFIEGYLRVGGDVEAVRSAGLPKYTRIFSVFTLPSVIAVISNACKNVRNA